MKTAQETLIQFIQKMKDYELYWGEFTQKSLDEGTFFEIDEDENSKKKIWWNQKNTLPIFI